MVGRIGAVLATVLQSLRFDIICIAYAKLFFMNLKPCKKRLGVSGGAFGSRLGISWETFGVAWGPLEDFLGGLGRSWDLLGALGTLLGPSWGHLGAFLETFCGSLGDVLGVSWGILWWFFSVWGPSWGRCGICHHFLGGFGELWGGIFIDVGSTKILMALNAE